MALRFLNSGYFAGSVGIGTDNPYNKTHITTSVDGDGLLLDYAGSNNKYVGVFFKIDNNTSDAYKKGALVWERTGSYNEGRFHFLLNNDDNASNVDLTDSKVTILSTGRVGIGTTEPTSKLTIADTAFTTAHDSIKGLFFDNSNITSGDENFGTGIEFGKLGSGGNLYKKAAIIPVQSGTDSDQMGISFFVSNSATQSSPVIEAMRVDYGGNVGIGTDEPGRLLELSKSVQSGQGATLRLTNEVGGAGAGVAIEFYGPGSQGIHAKIITEDLGAFDSNLIFQTKATASAGALADRLTIDNVGAIQFNDYGAGTLVTDASGNITVSSGGGAGGPYLPLTGGTLTGPLIVDTAGGAEKMTFNNEYNTAPIADSFVGNTSKSYISFGVVAGSNDPGFIMHESSSVAAYQNMGVLHLCPSDDNSTNDYVSIHGSNDPDVLKLHTSGLIETVNLQLQIKSGLNAVFVNDDLQVQNGGSFGGNLSVNGSNITLNGAYPRFNMYSTDVGEDDYSIINNNGTFGIYNNTEAFFPLSLAETSGNATFAGSLSVVGDIITGSALLSNQENTDIDTGAEVVAQVAHATYTAAFFDFVVKKGTNVRSGTVYACHNGDTTPLVEFTETSTNDLGDTSDVTLSVDISGTNMRLLATVTSDDWSVKSLIRAI